MPSSIAKSTCVKVCPASGRWKAPFVFLQWSVFFLCARAMAEQVVFTEIHYNPPAGKPEFIEVYNNTATIFDIANWDLKGGVEYKFPDYNEANPKASFLKSFERILLSPVSEVNLRLAYPTIPEGIRVFGPWNGSLGNGGESIQLENNSGTVICELDWDDNGRWPKEADGSGHSLSLRNPNRFIDDYRNWTFSARSGGTPGQPESSIRDTLEGGVQLSEVQVDSSKVAWVEIYNGGRTSINLTGLQLSSRNDFSDKIALQGNLSVGGHLVFDTTFPLTENGGFSLFISRTDGTVVDALALKREGLEIGFQEFPHGSGEWFNVDSSSRGAANNPARETNIVINELMIDPPSDQRHGEFIELHNKGGSPVNLSGWRFTDGVNFTFPAGTTLAAGGYMVVAQNPDQLKSIHGEIPVVGPYSGSLSNSGEVLRLVDLRGNFVDGLHYQVQGNWPDLVNGGGTSMELVHPDMDNSVGSAWRDSDESSKRITHSFSHTSTYQQWDSRGGTSDYKELHMFLTGDGEIIIDNLTLKKNGNGPNIITNVAKESTGGSANDGWLCQGTHHKSYVDAQGRLHIISTGHGDNKANRIEIDIPNISQGDNVTLSFDAQWVEGKSRLIVQTWDHSVGDAFLVPIPENLGTPGARNSRDSVKPLPQVNHILHSPPVPKTSEKVKITAKVDSVNLLARVEAVFRPDNNNASGQWEAQIMKDDGVAPDDIAGDGTYTVFIDKHRNDHQVIQFYVRATDNQGSIHTLPKQAEAWPAMYMFDNDTVTSDIAVHRFILSEFDREAIRRGDGAKFNYKFPTISNQYKNLTFIFNEQEVFYGGEVRAGGSPWHRRNTADLHARGKWKLPKDRLFRNRVKSTWDSNGSAQYHNRLVWYWLYLYGHAFSEAEFMLMYVNGSRLGVREDVEPNGNDLLDRQFKNGADGQLIRIDDEWWFQDDWNRGNRNSEWHYKDTENPIRYHSEWMMRSREQDYDFAPLIQLFKLATQNNYTEQEMNRVVDNVEITKHAAIRGYIGDWDSFTLGRGKNSYMYRRSTDGKFQFLHWDSDLGFRENNEFYNGRRDFKNWIEKPYNIRLFYHFLENMVAKYTKDSKRVQAWLECERDASGQYNPDINFYNNFFRNREWRAHNLMGANRTLPFTITTQNGQNFNTSSASASLTGTAPVKFFDVRVEGLHHAKASWDGITTWSLDGIQLRSGANVLKVQGVDYLGNVVEEKSITITLDKDAPPVASIDSNGASWKVPIVQPIELDASNTTDPEGGRIDFTWIHSQENVEILDGGQGQLIKAQFHKPGIYPFTLKAKDLAGNEVTVIREVSAYGRDGFSTFGDSALDHFWTTERVGPRANDIGEAWYSLDEEPGALRLQLIRGKARLLTGNDPGYAALSREVPSKTDWYFQTKVGLRTLQFGSFHTGLWVETEESGQFRRYFFGLDGGRKLSVQRIGVGSAQNLKSSTFQLPEVVLRVKHLSGVLLFEWKENGEWKTLHSVTLSGNPETLRTGLHLSTSSASESVGIAFDYAMLIDPALVSPLRGKLRVSEISYDPVGGSDHEFIEFVNISGESINLEGVKLLDGAPADEFIFSQNTLGAGEHLVVVRNRTAFLNYYGQSIAPDIAGEWGGGKLSNGGENITIVDGDGNLVLSFNYDDKSGWPGRAAGKGSTLEIIDPASDLENPENWRSSSEYGGTPGTVGSGPVTTILINEVLAHTDVPVLDTIELFNSTSQSVDISNWWITDSSDNWKKFQIPEGTSLAAGAYTKFDEKDFNPNGLWNPNPDNRGANEFTLGSTGDSTWLVEANASGTLLRFVDKAGFGASLNGVSFGRHTNSLNEVFFTAQQSSTLGSVNPGPKIGPIVISEIMYHPESGNMEWIELQNISDGDVQLFNPTHPDNTWRLSGIDFSFPKNVTMEKRGIFVLVNGDPDAFRLKHGIEEEVLIFGPFTGNLQDSGERITIERPDNPNQGDTTPPYVEVDAVRYNDKAPWPAEADGYGSTIVRQNVDRFGTDPAHWKASDDVGGTPGKSFLPPPEPVIKVVGGRSIEISVGTVYQDQGATAVDDVDGDVSSGITVDVSAADTSRIGTFKVWYSVTDKDGNESRKSRAVNVIPLVSQPSFIAHRYSFDGEGKIVPNLVGSGDATILGGAKLSGTGFLDLDGLNDYVDLPDGIISSLEDASFEMWINWKGPSTSQWQRVFEFGDDQFNYLYLTPKSSSSTSPVRYAFALNSGEKRVNAAYTIPSDGNTTTHMTVVFADTSDKAYLYINGELAGSRTTTANLSSLNDINNWLGRSQYAGRVPYFKGTFHEFRIYKRALGEVEVQASLNSGMNKATGPVISSFSSGTPKVSPGAQAMLSWGIEDATSITIDNGVGDVTGKTEFSVAPSVTTTYQLTTSNSAGTVTIPFTIIVDGGGNPDTDTDGDGWTDEQEFFLGTDPQDPQDHFVVSVSSTTAFNPTDGEYEYQLRWKSVPGRIYTIESSSDLEIWTQAAVVNGDGTEKTHSVLSKEAMGFFRLKIE